MNFAGRVYDGPWEGRSYESERPYFEINMVGDLPVGHFSRGFAPPVSVEVKRGFYRWSQPLRAWVFCWDNMPSRYAYEAYRHRVY